MSELSHRDSLVRRFVAPVRVVWSSDSRGRKVVTRALLAEPPVQASAFKSSGIQLKHDAGRAPGLLLDFGRELHGGIRLTIGLTNDGTADGKPVRVRVRLGESVAEAMGEPSQHHAIHDQLLLVAWAGSTEVGNTGFRFARVDLVDPGSSLELQGLCAVSLMRELPQLGAFESSDDRLNRIWQTGAYTVQLCMQDLLWDGIKRDRLVWAGDMHPETRVISAVFGEHGIVPASLDFARDEWPLPAWISGISSYSLWWIIVHRDWYFRFGRLGYLRRQRTYLKGLLPKILKHIDAKGRETLDGMRFLDWPSSGNELAIHAGLQALMVLGLTAAAELCDVMDESDLARRCRNAVTQLRRHRPTAPGSKQANALLSIAGLGDAKAINRSELAHNPLAGISTFYGYYVLQARAHAGDYRGCLKLIRSFWGAMLDRGATTFWEDFDLAWLKGSGRIDEPTPPGKKDLHADFGAHCYVGLRHSLCHGWAAGPTAWLSEHVLGFSPAGVGSTRIRIAPHLGDLQWVRGSFPTPLGAVHVEHCRRGNKIDSVIDAPAGVTITEQN